MGWLALALGLAVLGAFLYWQLVIAEGAYFGKRLVVLLYDWSAHLYERIKQYDVGDEQWFLGLPLGRALEQDFRPHSCSTSRPAAGACHAPSCASLPFEGRVIGLDLSRRMLQEATRSTAQFADRLTYIWQDAEILPFRADTFDAVTCFEALELMPDPRRAVAELVRVLRPGGILLATNRIGRHAKFCPAGPSPRGPGRASREPSPREHQDPPLADRLRTGVGRQVGHAPRRRCAPSAGVMRCPVCQESLERISDAFGCTVCGRIYPIAEDDGVIEMAHSA